MTIQQLEYIVALNKFRHFVTASKHCAVSQPTLSLMIKKLELELDVTIFDRTKHPIKPTKMGIRIIEQAESTLREMRKINEMIISESEMLACSLHIGIIPTLSPYLVPKFIAYFKEKFPQVELSISEMQTKDLIKELDIENIDIFIAATPLEQADFYEIPLYYEKFVAYFSSKTPNNFKILSADNMPKKNLWVLEQGHCLRDQTFNFCKETISYNQVFESGSIETLIEIVDNNGGYSIIPELHIPFLSKTQKQNVCEIKDPPALREISIVIKKDFIKERIINAVADTIKNIIHERMLDKRLKKFAIKL